MTQTIAHPPVRREFCHTHLLDGCTVNISKTRSVITYTNPAVADRIIRRLPQWLADGMLEGSPIGTNKKFAWMK